MLKLFFAIAAGYALLIVAVYFLQDRMLYFAHVPGRTLTMRHDGMLENMPVTQRLQLVTTLLRFIARVMG